MECNPQASKQSWKGKKVLDEVKKLSMRIHSLSSTAKENLLELQMGQRKGVVVGWDGGGPDNIFKYGTGCGE